MSVTVVAFFNNKGGVGKTSLVYHLAWMFADRGKRVLAVDLDPQANLSAFFIDEDKLALLWPEEDARNNTIFTAVHPLLRGVGDVSTPYLEPIQENLALIPGDMQLSRFENDLSVNWSECLDRKERGFRVMSAFWRVIQAGAREHKADVALVRLRSESWRDQPSGVDFGRLRRYSTWSRSVLAQGPAQPRPNASPMAQ